METLEKDAIHPIGVAAERAGLTPDVIRAWERRYGVVEPSRDDAGRRVYTSADIQRLRLLARATEGGRSIGQVVGLATPDLEALVQEDEAARRAAAPRTVVPPRADDLVEAALDRVRALDAPGLDRLLTRAATVHGVPAFLRGVLAPLFRAIGDLWHSGRLQPAQEHMASAVVRGVMARVTGAVPVPDDAPVLLVATPAGERHEIGALLVAAAATVEGWRITYLGADLPATEIAAAAREVGARAVALSVVYAPDPEGVASEIEAVRAALPQACALLVGGAATPGLGARVADAGAVALKDLDDLHGQLQVLTGR